MLYASVQHRKLLSFGGVKRPVSNPNKQLDTYFLELLYLLIFSILLYLLYIFIPYKMTKTCGLLIHSTNNSFNCENITNYKFMFITGGAGDMDGGLGRKMMFPQLFHPTN